MSTIKSLAVVFILATTTFAQSTSNFEVKELDASLVSGLVVAEAKLSNALAVLKAAQEAVSTAQEARDEIVKKVKDQYGQFESACQWGGYITGGGHMMPKPASFKTVEIRGKYALITSGEKPCPTSFTTLTNSVSH